MHRDLTDINKLLLILAEATHFWEFLYWLLNQQNSWLSSSSNHIGGYVQARKNTTSLYIPGCACRYKHSFIYKHTASWIATPVAEDYKPLRVPLLPFSKWNQLWTPGRHPYAFYWYRQISLLTLFSLTHFKGKRYCSINTESQEFPGSLQYSISSLVACYCCEL